MVLGSRCMLRALDKLVCAQARSTATVDELQRLRVLAGVSLLQLIEVVIITGGAVLAGNALATASFLVPMAVAGLVQAVVLLRLRVTGGTRGSGWLVCLTVLGGVISVSIHEGSLYTLMSPSAALVVVLGYYLVGPRAAALLTGLVVFATVTVVGAHHNGLALSPIALGPVTTIVDAMGSITILLGLLGLLVLMNAARERSVRRLRRALAELKSSEAQRSKMEVELRLSHRLQAVGRLAAGVAHEINTPVQYITDSVDFGGEVIRGMDEVLALYQDLCGRYGDAIPVAEIARIRAAEEAVDLDYLRDHAERAAERARTGLEKVAYIVKALREFGKPEQEAAGAFRLNDAIANTITLALGEFSPRVDVQTNFGQLPELECFAGQLNQVILTLLVNAAEAIEARVDAPEDWRGTINVRTRTAEGMAVLEVGDNGCGMSPAVQADVFEPFFSTKSSTRAGAGCGLASARAIVVDMHHGNLTFRSDAGVGTTFEMRVPLTPPALREETGIPVVSTHT